MSLLNYIIEANIGLIIFLSAYVLFLRHETDFQICRIFLLGGILFSLIFPLFHIQSNANVLPTLGNILPTYVLPNVVIFGEGPVDSRDNTSIVANAWVYALGFYIVGFFFFLVRFIVRMTRLIKTLSVTNSVRVGNLNVVELNNGSTTFSFFRFVVLGKSNMLTDDEKQKIIEHETVHVRQFHSLDILLLNVLGIFFWFNPLLRSYNKIFVQLHEFEADARAVEKQDVNEYCSLLARVALESAGLKLANHFNNSLTLKRIEMMRTIKRKIRPWKMAVIAAVIPLTFFIISCQDQVASETVTSSTTSTDIPDEVQEKYEALVKANPDKKFLVMETDKNMVPKREEMKQQFEKLDQRQITHIEIITPTANSAGAARTFTIVEYEDVINPMADGNVFTIVDESATPQGGIDELRRHIMTKLTYPAQARQMGIEGSVFVEFIVNTDGSISDVKVLKGIGAGCDEAAVVVVKTLPKWNPAKNKGELVRQKFVVPIAFKLAASPVKK